MPTVKSPTNLKCEHAVNPIGKVPPESAIDHLSRKTRAGSSRMPWRSERIASST